MLCATQLLPNTWVSSGILWIITQLPSSNPFLLKLLEEWNNPRGSRLRLECMHHSECASSAWDRYFLQTHIEDRGEAKKKLRSSAHRIIYSVFTSQTGFEDFTIPIDDDDASFGFTVFDLKLKLHSNANYCFSGQKWNLLKHFQINFLLFSGTRQISWFLFLIIIKWRVLFRCLVRARGLL